MKTNKKLIKTAIPGVKYFKKNGVEWLVRPGENKAFSIEFRKGHSAWVFEADEKIFTKEEMERLRAALPKASKAPSLKNVFKILVLVWILMQIMQ